MENKGISKEKLRIACLKGYSHEELSSLQPAIEKGKELLTRLTKSYLSKRSKEENYEEAHFSCYVDNGFYIWIKLPGKRLYTKMFIQSSLTQHPHPIESAKDEYLSLLLSLGVTAYYAEGRLD